MYERQRSDSRLQNKWINKDHLSELVLPPHFLALNLYTWSGRGSIYCFKCSGKNKKLKERDILHTYVDVLHWKTLFKDGQFDSSQKWSQIVSIATWWLATEFCISHLLFNGWDMDQTKKLMQVSRLAPNAQDGRVRIGTILAWFLGSGRKWRSIVRLYIHSIVKRDNGGKIHWQKAHCISQFALITILSATSCVLYWNSVFKSLSGPRQKKEVCRAHVKCSCLQICLSEVHSLH